MRHPEPDLEAILRLLDARAWRRFDLDGVEARRMAAMCGLAWLAGARQAEMGRLRRGDWRPDGEAAVRLWGGEVDAGARLPKRPRLIPALPLLRRLVEARLADVADPGPDAQVLAAGAGRATGARGWVEGSAPWVAALSGGRVSSPIDLADRYRSYCYWNGVAPEVAIWLAGSTGRERAPDPPPLSRLRRVLRENHPAAAPGRG